MPAGPASRQMAAARCIFHTATATSTEARSNTCTRQARIRECGLALEQACAHKLVHDLSAGTSCKSSNRSHSHASGAV